MRKRLVVVRREEASGEECWEFGRWKGDVQEGNVEVEEQIRRVWRI